MGNREQMKFKNTLVGAVAFLVLSLSAFAGTKDGHGGDGTKSEIRDVTSTLDQMLYGWPGSHIPAWGLREPLADMYRSLGDQPILPIRDVRARRILAKIYSSPFVRIKPDTSSGAAPDTFDMRIHVYVHRLARSACMDQGEKRDASAKIERTSRGDVAHICLSVQRLARYPSNELRSQIAALLFHEFAHLAGFEEDDAAFIQKYVLATLTSTCTIKIPVDNSSWFELSLFQAYLLRVEYIRRIDRSPSGYHLVTTMAELAPDAFKINWDAGSMGQLNFSALNYDGTLSPQSLRWLSTTGRPTNYPGSPYIASGVTGQMSMDGKALAVPDRIAISPGCRR